MAKKEYINRKTIPKVLVNKKNKKSAIKVQNKEVVKKYVQLALI